MSRNLLFLSGLGVGLGLMYLLDPNQGARRRALLRDRSDGARGQCQRMRRRADSSSSSQHQVGGGYAAAEVMSRARSSQVE